MKISNKGPGQISNPSADSAAVAKSKMNGLEGALDAKKTKSIDAASVAGASRVDVSPRAQEMAKAKELATPSNDIDEAKVARLQALIDGGKYKVDAEAVAERLLGEHTKMN